MPRDGSKNLTPLNKRTKEERKKIAMMGGVASGRARSAKANLRRTLELALELVAPQANKEALMEKGYEVSENITLEDNLALSTIQRAIEGDGKARDAIFKALSVYEQQNASKEDDSIRVEIISKERVGADKDVDTKGD